MVSLSKITRKGKALFLAYDQGMEHGPTDFNDLNVDPSFIIDIAKKGKFTGLVFQKGIAQKYKGEIKRSKVPLIVKLNGKTNLRGGEPISRQLCTVHEAVQLGAVAVGYTIYLGSKFEADMFSEFENIKREADRMKIPTIIWMYPRGQGVKNKKKSKLMAYAARVALELGADIVKLQYHGSRSDLSWAVKSAGKTKVVIAGGKKISQAALLSQVKDIMAAKGIGLAIGRNVWQSKDSLATAQAMSKLVFKT